MVNTGFLKQIDLFIQSIEQAEIVFFRGQYLTGVRMKCKNNGFPSGFRGKLPQPADYFFVTGMHPIKGTNGYYRP
jgi:hypothetical protein